VSWKSHHTLLLQLSDARGLRLLITEDDPETRLMIGHENSLLHKRIYFDVDSSPPLTKIAQ
jgi:hypothetical protein